MTVVFLSLILETVSIHAKTFIEPGCAELGNFEADKVIGTTREIQILNPHQLKNGYSNHAKHNSHWQL